MKQVYVKSLRVKMSISPVSQWYMVIDIFCFKVPFSKHFLLVVSQMCKKN